MKSFILYISILSLVFSCSAKKVLDPIEYIKYLNSEESGLLKTREFNTVQYKAKIQLPELLAANASENITKERFESNLAYYRNKVNFIFTMQDNGSSLVRSLMFDKEKYGTLLSYANTDLKNDFKLLNGIDTLYCALVHLESANSVQPVLRITLGFSGLDSIGNDMTLIYNDNIFNNGPVKFYYSKEVINNLPEIKLR